MPLLSIRSRLFCREALLFVAALLSSSMVLTKFAARADQPLSDSVGVIDGEAVTVSGPMSVELVRGQAKTVLRSGSDVHVKSGTAHIDLVEGGQISICGPAHLSVLKSRGALTVALETGTIHAHLPEQAGVERGPVLTIYTPQIQAHPMAIGDGPQDMLVGIESPRTMCIRANRGAIRVEQQFTGQNVIIPQAGDVLLTNGQLENLSSGVGHCTCELQTVPAMQVDVGLLANAEEARKNGLDAKADPPPATAEIPVVRDEPIYQVFMPPLIYDAKAKLQPEVDPKMIILVRRVRVRPTLIFQGRVEGELVAAATLPPSAPSGGASESPPKPAAPANDSFVGRVRSFVRKLWSRGS